MDAHLTADELRGFARHEGSPADVRRIARHLQSCDECRGHAPARGIVSTILGVDEEHLTFEQLAAIADGETAEGEEHSRRCATCARELADLREFRESRVKKRRTASQAVLTAAAAAVLITLLGIPFFITRRNETLLADVALPTEVLAMQSRHLTFRGAANTQALDVIEPRDTVVMSDRPQFRWNAPAGSTSIVEIFAPDFTRVAASPPLTTTTWTPPSPLPRGVTYRWQVTAGDVTIPAPPLPEALFLVVPEDQANAVRELEQTKRPSLALASAYAKAGDFDRARTELRSLIAAGKQTSAAKKLLGRINGVTR